MLVTELLMTASEIVRGSLDIVDVDEKMYGFDQAEN